MSTSAHPAFETLVDLVEGRLVPEEQAAVRAHVAACTACAADVAWLRRTIEVMRADDAEAPPEHVVNRAVRLFRQHLAAPGPPATPVASLRERIAAVLRFDSGERALAFGLRAGAGGGTAGGRQFVYEAGAYEVEVRQTPGDQGWVIAGQVLGPPAAGGGTAALEGPPGRVEVALNDLSEFGFPPRPEGRYTLRLRLGDTDVEIGGLTVPPAGP